jgi:hypothetical protein
MIVASRNHGRVRAASAWAEFGQGAAARTVGKLAAWAVDRTHFPAPLGALGSLERLS